MCDWKTSILITFGGKIEILKLSEFCQKFNAFKELALSDPHL